MGMILCKSCGKKVSKTYQRCPYCGQWCKQMEFCITSDGNCSYCGKKITTTAGCDCRYRNIDLKKLTFGEWLNSDAKQHASEVELIICKRMFDLYNRYTWISVNTENNQKIL